MTAPLRMSFDVAGRIFERTADGVEIEHRGWERLGGDGQAWRDRNQAGWQSQVPHYLAALEKH